MFDAKSILENIVRGAASSQPSGAPGGGSGGGLGDLINEIGRSLSQQQGAAPAGGQTPASGTSGTSIGDILGDLARQFGQPSSNATPDSLPQAPGSTPASRGGASSPDLGDVLAQIKDKLNQAGGAVSDGGSITDILGKILTQATQGVSEGASRVGQATGASDALGRAAADPRAAEILNQLKGVLQSNPFAAGTAAGGLGIVMIFEDWLRPYFATGALEPVLEPWWQRFSGPFLYYAGRRLVPAPLKAFVDFIRRNQNEE